MPALTETVEQVQSVEKYKYGFVTDIETDSAPKGLNEDIVRFISAKKNEPKWLLEWRLKAFAHWLTLEEPDWAKVGYPPIDYQDAYYYSAPKTNEDAPETLDDVDPELLSTYEKLGIPLHEQEILAGVKNVAVDAVFDSVSVATTFKETLKEAGVIFCPISEAVRDYPELVQQYMGSVVPVADNYFAALNSAVFTDGSFVFIPKGVRCPMELSTYFRINAANTGQFERTLIIAEDNSYVSYLEGCTAPMRDENQLHAAVVELVAMDDAEIKYSTVQNWYPGDENGVGGIYNFVTKRGSCRGKSSKISWTQVETGSAITWKYPSCILQGDNSVGEFYSADTAFEADADEHADPDETASPGRAAIKLSASAPSTLKLRLTPMRLVILPFRTSPGTAPLSRCHIWSRRAPRRAASPNISSSAILRASPSPTHSAGARVPERSPFSWPPPLKIGSSRTRGFLPT